LKNSDTAILLTDLKNKTEQLFTALKEEIR